MKLLKIQGGGEGWGVEGGGGGVGGEYVLIRFGSTTGPLKYRLEFVCLLGTASLA